MIELDTGSEHLVKAPLEFYFLALKPDKKWEGGLIYNSKNLASSPISYASLWEVPIVWFGNV